MDFEFGCFTKTNVLGVLDAFLAYRTRPRFQVLDAGVFPKL